MLKSMVCSKNTGLHGEGIRAKLDERTASPVALVVKNLPANAGDVKAIALIPGSGRPPGVKHGKRIRHN